MGEPHDARNGKQATSSEGGGSPGRDRGLDLRTAHIWHFQPVRDLLVIAIVAGTVYAGYAMRTVTVPLLVAFALAYLVEPVVSRMSRWRGFSRPVAVTAILSALATILAVLMAIVVPIAVGQTLSFASGLRSGRYDASLTRLVEALPAEYQGDARAFVGRFLHPLEKPGPDGESVDEERGEDGDAGTGASHIAGEAGVAERAAEDALADAGGDDGAEEGEAAKAPRPGTVGDALAQLPDSMREASKDNPLLALLGAGSRQVYALALTVLQLSLVAFLIPFYFFYFSVYWPDITGFFAKLVPDERRGAIMNLVTEMDRAVAGFVRGRIVICAAMGAMFAVGWQACGVPYGIALGLLTGALSIVPYLGGVGWPLAVGLLVVDQYGLPPDERMAVWAMILWPSLVFIVVQTIESYLLTPVIAGKATNLDPVTIVVAILAGGSVAGVYGMLLAIPIAACGKIALRRIVMPRLVEFARGRVADPLPIEAGREPPAEASSARKEHP